MCESRPNVTLTRLWSRKRANLKTEVTKKLSTSNLRKNEYSYPARMRTYVRTRAYQGVKNICFSEYLACFVFLLLPF